MTHPYHVLGVHSGATDEDIKKVYKKLARKLHPDRNPSPKAEKRFKKINEAYEILSDPTKRKMYDEFGEISLKQGFSHRSARQPGGPGFTGGFGFGADGYSGGGMDDILGSIFRGMSGDPRQREMRGHDQQTTLRVPAMLTFLGGAQELSVRRPSGDIDRIKIKIKPGTSSGDKLRLRGQGLPPPGGGPCGDLVVLIQVDEHPHLRRDQANLHMDVPITLGEAVRGGIIEVPTPTGTTKVTLPTHCANKRLRLRRRGVQIDGDPGHLVITLRAALPEPMTPEMEEAITTLESGYGSPVRANLSV